MPELTIMIKLDTDTQGCQVACDPPSLLGSKMAVYGLLELARDAICEYHRKQAESPILRPTMVMPTDFDPHGN